MGKKSFCSSAMRWRKGGIVWRLKSSFRLNVAQIWSISIHYCYPNKQLVTLTLQLSAIKGREGDSGDRKMLILTSRSVKTDALS